MGYETDPKDTELRDVLLDTRLEIAERIYEGKKTEAGIVIDSFVYLANKFNGDPRETGKEEKK